MYLYDREDKKINVYELNANKERLAKYKKEELEKAICPKFRFFKSKATDKRPLEERDVLLYWMEIYDHETLYWSDGHYHFMEFYLPDEEEVHKQARILNDYYEGKFSQNKVFEVYDYNEKTSTFKVIEHLLLTQPYEPDENNLEISVMHNILSIPKSLYLLQVLE